MSRPHTFLEDVIYSLVPTAAFADFELRRSFPPIQIISQGGTFYYVIAVPRLLRVRWSILNQILGQRQPIHNLVLLDALHNFYPPGLSGIVVTMTGRFHVFINGVYRGEARYTGPSRRGAIATANWFATRRDTHPMLRDVNYSFVPVGAFNDFELGRSFMPLRTHTQHHHPHYLLAVPRHLHRVGWSGLNSVLARRVPIQDSGMVRDLNEYAAVGFTGVVVSATGRFHVFIGGMYQGEARFTGPGRRGAFAAAAAAVARRLERNFRRHWN